MQSRFVNEYNQYIWRFKMNSDYNKYIYRCLRWKSLSFSSLKHNRLKNIKLIAVFHWKLLPVWFLSVHRQSLPSFSPIFELVWPWSWYKQVWDMGPTLKLGCAERLFLLQKKNWNLLFNSSVFWTFFSISDALDFAIWCSEVWPLQPHNDAVTEIYVSKNGWIYQYIQRFWY